MVAPLSTRRTLLVTIRTRVDNSVGGPFTRLEVTCADAYDDRTVGEATVADGTVNHVNLDIAATSAAHRADLMRRYKSEAVQRAVAHHLSNAEPVSALVSEMRGLGAQLRTAQTSPNELPEWHRRAVGLIASMRRWCLRAGPYREGCRALAELLRPLQDIRPLELD